MAVTNLHLAKHLDGSPVNISDLKIGLLVTFPSGMGGVFNMRCVLLNDNVAEFKNTHKDWPTEVVCDLNAEDLTTDELKQLVEAMDAFDSWRKMPTKEQHILVHRAHELGYVNQRSYTQVEWRNRPEV
jgi:hypothetical protein